MAVAATPGKDERRRRSGGSDDDEVGKYQLGKTLGNLGFAKVKYAKHVDKGDCIAIKVLDMEAQDGRTENGRASGLIRLLVFRGFRSCGHCCNLCKKVSTWVDPGVLKHTHRIGRGSIGDVWLATHHRSTTDYEEYHDVPVKMLNSIKDDQIEVFLAKFEDLFLKCQGLKVVCYLHGISVIKGRVNKISFEVLTIII